MFSIFSQRKKQDMERGNNDNGSGNANTKSRRIGSTRAYYQQIGKAVWTDRNYVHLAEESYVKNVIANRCISIITKSAASIKLALRHRRTGEFIREHRILNLLRKPNPLLGQTDFFETIHAHRLIAGNVFIQAIFNKQEPQELHLLRPDRVTVMVGDSSSIPLGYKYRVNNQETFFAVNQISGQSPLLHIRNFHPTNDWYGLSQVEPAAYSIDQHNEASKWNQAMLQNGAKPSGALLVKNDMENNGFLTDDQFERLKEQLNEEFSGSANAGKPLLLEGGLDWKEISLSPREMDFLEMKHSTARDIALSFGVPSQLIGIPGDNTYNNMVEARLFLWEQTILPAIDGVLTSLNNWLIPLFENADEFELTYSKRDISALSARKENFWNMVNSSTFLTDEEKRRILEVPTTCL